jgi:hypothetical protein
VRTLLVAALIAVIALGAVAWFGWRWAAQTVNLVIVNASGIPAQFSWQPQLFADEETITIGGCEGKSMELRAGERWHFVHDRLEMNSSVVDVPVFAREVAVEIWLAADGSSRYVPAYPVDAPINAPHPEGCAPTR